MNLIFGNIADFEKYLIVRKSIPDILIFVIALEMESGEYHFALVDEGVLGLNLFGIFPRKWWSDFFGLFYLLLLGSLFSLESCRAQFLNLWSFTILLVRHLEVHICFIFLFEFDLVLCERFLVNIEILRVLFLVVDLKEAVLLIVLIIFLFHHFLFDLVGILLQVVFIIDSSVQISEVSYLAHSSR